MTPCRFYLQGRCTYGARCRFSHDATASIASQIRGNSNAARYMRGQMSVQDYMMASDDEGDFDEDEDMDDDDDDDEEDEEEEDSDEDSDDEEEDGESGGLSERLRRLFKTADTIKRYPADWANLPSAVVEPDGDEFTALSKRNPPPSRDPRTHLPQIFRWRGWGAYNSPHFSIREPHDPQYPSDLVARLRQLHESGAALKKQDGWEYVAVFYGVDDEDGYGEESDEDEDMSDDGKSEQILGTFETLEQANDMVMDRVEEEHASHMQYQEGEADDSNPEIGLLSFVHKDQEDDLQYGDEGLTWEMDDVGCLMFSALEGGEIIEYFVEKRKKSSATGK